MYTIYYSNHLYTMLNTRLNQLHNSAQPYRDEFVLSVIHGWRFIFKMTAPICIHVKWWPFTNSLCLFPQCNPMPLLATNSTCYDISLVSLRPLAFRLVCLSTIVPAIISVYLLKTLWPIERKNKYFPLQRSFFPPHAIPVRTYVHSVEFKNVSNIVFIRNPVWCTGGRDMCFILLLWVNVLICAAKFILSRRGTTHASRTCEICALLSERTRLCPEQRGR